MTTKEAVQAIEGAMIDLKDADTVQIKRSAEGRLWVNVDGVCRLRIGNAKTLSLEFDRPFEATVE